MFGMRNEPSPVAPSVGEAPAPAAIAAAGLFAD